MVAGSESCVGGTSSVEMSIALGTLKMLAPILAALMQTYTLLPFQKKEQITLVPGVEATQ